MSDDGDNVKVGSKEYNKDAVKGTATLMGVGSAIGLVGGAMTGVVNGDALPVYDHNTEVVASQYVAHLPGKRDLSNAEWQAKFFAEKEKAEKERKVETDKVRAGNIDRSTDYAKTGAATGAAGGAMVAGGIILNDILEERRRQRETGKSQRG